MARSSLRPFIDRIERSHGASPDVVRELLENCALPVLILERLWKDTRRALERGVERAELVRTLHEIRELLGRLGPDHDELPLLHKPIASHKRFLTPTSSI